MAAKKNPLSAMLNSDSRVQAKEFQRDYTVASTIKGVGDYAVGVTKPLPASQTSMGRLAQSLGAASGLLKEFSDYQIQKDQLDLQSAALEGKIATQEIAGQKALIELENSKLRGSITNETIKQQNIRLDMLKQQEIVAEFDSMFEGMTEEQKVNFEIGVAENAKKAEEGADKALGKAAVVTAKTGTEKEQQTFKEIYANRRKGAGLFNAYDEYFKSEATKKLSAINEENITTEQADAIGPDIQNSFIEMSNLEEGSEELKGFLIATSKYNQKNMASLATNAKEKAKAIGSERLIFSIADTTKTSDTLDESQLAELRIKADEGTLRTFLTAKDGIINSIINLRDPEAIDNLADVLQEQLSDLPIGDGRTLKETLYYEASLSDLDEAETKLLAEERNKEDLNETIARDKFKDIAYSLTRTKTPKEIRALFSAAATGKSKEAYYKTLPEQADALKEVFDLFPEDTSIEEINASLNSVTEAVIADKNEQANLFIKSNTKNDVDLSKPKFAEEVFIDIKKNFDENKADGVNQAPESAFLINFLGDSVTSGLGLSEYRMALFDRMSGGLFTQYREARESLPDLVKESYDPASDDAKEFLKLELSKYDERLKSGIKSFVEGRVSRKAEITQEGAFGFIGKEKVEALIKQNPFLPIPEIREIIEKQREDELKAIKAERRRLDPEFESKIKDLRSPEKLFETNEKIREVLLGNDLRDRKSEAFSSLSKAAGELFFVKQAPSFFGFEPLNMFGLMEYKKDRKEAVDNYTRLHAQAEQSQRVRMKTGVTAKEILDIAQTAATLPDAELVGNELIIPLIAREDSFNFSDIASPSYYGNPTGEGYVKETPGIFKGQSNYAKIMEAARVELRDITVPKSFFAKTNPALRDLKLGDKGSSSYRIKEADVTKALKDLEMTEDQLLDVAELYGHEDIVSFLRAQYDTPYHRNQRK